MVYTLEFPFDAFVFDFSHEGEGVANIIDRYGEPARLRLRVRYPFSADPNLHNLWIEDAWLMKKGRGYEVSPRYIKIVKPPEKEDDNG